MAYSVVTPSSSWVSWTHIGELWEKIGTDFSRPSCPFRCPTLSTEGNSHHWHQSLTWPEFCSTWISHPFSHATNWIPVLLFYLKEFHTQFHTSSVTPLTGPQFCCSTWKNFTPKLLADMYNCIVLFSTKMWKLCIFIPSYSRALQDIFIFLCSSNEY